MIPAAFSANATSLASKAEACALPVSSKPNTMTAGAGATEAGFEADGGDADADEASVTAR
ncbi:hypothetical protein [Aureimonas jatrophae]|uniref:hypothetical protein n=1 Tax=Aureimonas jatrophae TaxID=1166073 RepID=UPI000B860148|nr:hypothetical protein [Aureimonas jatrophae]